MQEIRDIQQVVDQAREAIEKVQILEELQQYQVRYFGKQGELTAILKNLGQLAPEDRPVLGQKINQAKQELQSVIEARREILVAQRLQKQLAKQRIDVTLPGRGNALGKVHPVTQTRVRIEEIFSRMGFTVVSGPEIEDDYHNFTALNIPKFHPARAMQDTFYFPDGSLLRSQMSPVQIRVMEDSEPPFRIIAPGRVYRRDFDITHTPMFHQVEGLMVDENVSFSDLKGIIVSFLEQFFNQDINIRFRPSYFPFTEPSAEVDIGCVKCKGYGCRICSDTGWLEVLGCGMVHPNVFNFVHVDNEVYNGFAFGLGIDRLAMLRHGIDDLRMLFENDLRFLRQF